MAGSRNDGHGLHLLPRTQAFVDGLADQVRRYARHVELVLVDWNGPDGVPPLSEVLYRPPVDGFTFRIVSVPHDLHTRLSASSALRFFQMIAKNVGIRRSTGDAILATNIDILLSDDLFLDSTKPLRDYVVYRSDRFDIPFEPSQTTDPQLLRRSQPIRMHRKSGIFYPEGGLTYPHVRGVKQLLAYLLNDPVDFVRRALRWSGNGPPSIRRYRRAVTQVLLLPRLHFNACGDFTLMTRRSWYKLGGYPEWEMYSWNLDSLLLYQAAAAGFEFVDVDGHPAYHMEHSGGWTPESQLSLFERLSRDGVPVLTDADLVDVAKVIWGARRSGFWRTNLEGWGMAHDDLPNVQLA